MTIYDKWNKKIDTEGLQKDIKDAEKGTINYEKLPAGEYEVKVDKLELKESKKGDPMVAVWYRVVEGNYKNQIIFQNQVITRGFQIHIVNEILRALVDNQMDIKFENYSQYNDLLLDVFELIDGNYEFALKYGENDKGFDTFKITEVFEV